MRTLCERRSMRGNGRHTETGTGRERDREATKTDDESLQQLRGLVGKDVGC